MRPSQRSLSLSEENRLIQRQRPQQQPDVTTRWATGHHKSHLGGVQGKHQLFGCSQGKETLQEEGRRGQARQAVRD